MLDNPPHFTAGQVTAGQVAHYYDQNTARFLRLGGSGETAAIHRQIWAPGVENRRQAFLYLNQLVAQAVRPALPAGEAGRILDLGCGVGGTSTWLAQRLGAQVTGITNSAVQQQAAVIRAERLGLSEACNFILADFEYLPTPADPAVAFDAAYAIESFVHASDAARFFAMACEQIRPGGRLVICDDFLSPQGTPSLASRQAQKWVQRFRQGWRLSNLLPVETTLTLAEQVGFRLLQAYNLTPYLRRFHPILLWAVRWITHLPLHWAYWHNLSGGTALQYCAQQGWVQYRALVWEKRREG